MVPVPFVHPLIFGAPPSSLTQSDVVLAGDCHETTVVQSVFVITQGFGEIVRSVRADCREGGVGGVGGLLRRKENELVVEEPLFTVSV